MEKLQKNDHVMVVKVYAPGAYTIGTYQLNFPSCIGSVINGCDGAVSTIIKWKLRYSSYFRDKKNPKKHVIFEVDGSKYPVKGINADGAERLLRACQTEFCRRVIERIGDQSIRNVDEQPLLITLRAALQQQKRVERLTVLS